MANHDSTTVTNLEASPSVVADVAQIYGKLRVMEETFEIEAADNDGDTFTLFPVPLDARISDVKVLNDAITGGTNYDIGFYLITAGNLGAVVDADIIADGIDFSSASTTWTSVLFVGSGAKDQGAIANKVWEDLGYASLTAAREAAGNSDVYMVITANTVGSAAGTVSVRAEIVVD